MKVWSLDQGHMPQLIELCSGSLNRKKSSSSQVDREKKGKKQVNQNN